MEPCVFQHPLDPHGQQWLKEIFTSNGIDPSAFSRDVNSVLSCAHPKKRTLFLEGASNTGKTLLLELALSSHHGAVGYAELTGKERFELSPIVDAPIAVLSEFRATIVNVDKAKRLFGGEKLAVEVKNRKQVIINERRDNIKPVFVTAQTGWSTFLGSSDLAAIQNRTRSYKLNVPLPECSVTICPCYWEDLCNAQETSLGGGHNQQSQQDG
jgi:hypothetical protein